MTNVFIVPAADEAARENLERTVRQRVSLARLKGLSSASLAQARAVAEGVSAWGTRAGPSGRNVTTWSAMEAGDWALFYSERRFPVAGRVLLRERSRRVAEELWGTDGEDGTWEYLYLIDQLRWIDAPRHAVRAALRYSQGYNPRGFTRVNRAPDPRYRDVEEMLADLAATGVALKRAVEAIGSGDDAAAAVAIEPLVDRMSKRALEDSIAGYVASDPPRVRKAKVRRISRGRTLVIKLKELYGGHCQCCGFTFAKVSGEPYSEVAHLRPISELEANLDTKDNLVVLCANHHKMLDLGPIEIVYDTATDKLLLHENGKTTALVNKHIGPSRPKKKRPGAGSG